MASIAANKRLKPKIKPPRKHGTNISVDETWSKLTHNIREIQYHRAHTLSFEENYRFAYQMVIMKNGKQLYEGTVDLVVENLDRLVKEILQPNFPTSLDQDPMQRAHDDARLLSALSEVWADHKGSMDKIGSILKYMDRVWTKDAHLPEIVEKGRELFLKHIIRPPIQGHVQSAVLGLLRIERDGYVINRSSVTGCVDVLLQLNDPSGLTVYKRDLEPVVLSESQAYYKAEGERLLETCDAPEYLRRVEARFTEEDSRAHQCLSVQTAKPLEHILQETLLTPHLMNVLRKENSGLDAMIDKDSVNDLSRLYSLYSEVPEGVPALRRAIKDSIVRRGTALNTVTNGEGESVGVDEEAEAVQGKGKGKARAGGGGGAQSLALALKWVEDVLALKDKFDNVLISSFRRNRDLESGMNEAFETFINQQPRAPEFTSLFIDENLKKGLKGKTDEEVEEVLGKTITVFRYLTKKDEFELYYKNHLAKRLLNNRSVSDDAERGMLAKLKVECGYQFTQKLEGMFHDMRISADTMEAYKGHVRKLETAPEVDMAVTVMTATLWPMSTIPMPCTLPPVLIRSSHVFEQFYLGRHNGRRLTWLPSLGTADVRVRFNARSHELNVSTFALCVLMLFEDVEEGGFLTYEEIKESTGIPEAELMRNLQSLACAKFKVLKKHPPGRDVKTDDSFSFNESFSAPLQKIKISTVAARVESGVERRETQDRIEEERKHQTEAAIVRIMKDRKTMAHNALVNEVTRQLASRFQPNPVQIKKRIEGLIEREYLERCADRKSYNYLA
ncbi:unnamed protein product [Peniophora sp. CBMAI 1063]|nr:unnamed protein product [Peniophora sp. CBMAI 1063]